VVCTVFFVEPSHNRCQCIHATFWEQNASFVRIILTEVSLAVGCTRAPILPQTLAAQLRGACASLRGLGHHQIGRPCLPADTTGKHVYQVLYCPALSDAVSVLVTAANSRT
jgi:hypothetical protein